MQFTPTPISGAFLVDVEPKGDHRGLFARTWCAREFAEQGLIATLAQCSVSYNASKFTLRGMHYQAEPQQETKLVRCVAGAIYDVIIDLRPASPTYKRWFGVELTSANRRAVYVPAGLAHGFMTTEAESEVFYQISEFYAPDCARGLRWDDPAFGIEWPMQPTVISDRDASYPTFSG